MSKYFGGHSYQSVPDRIDPDIEMIVNNFQNKLEMESENDPVDESISRKVSEEVPLKYRPSKRNITVFGVIAAVSFLVTLSLVISMSNPNEVPILNSENSMFDARNRYVLRNFDVVRPMSNFLNGLGGIWGIPMWAFYVNRGQAITSFGKQNKDNAIAKFVTAEKAYLQTPYTGFRTFLKASRNGEDFNYMPFFPRPAGDHAKIERNMIIGLNELEIEEINADHLLQTNVLYYIAPEQTFPSLVRSITLTNLDVSSDLDVDILDGLGQLIPNGLGNFNIDAMGRTMEAWMNVYNVGLPSHKGNIITEPFFHISQDTADTPQVHLIKDGYFAIAYVDGEQSNIDLDGKHQLLPFIVDPSLVFDTDTTLMNPSGFFDSKGVNDLLSSPQGTTSRTPCAYAGTKLRIPAGKNVTITSIYGYAESLETLTEKYSPLLRSSKYSESKRQAAENVVNEVVSLVESNTSSAVFNAYIKQDFLDNVLRGGLPIQLGDNHAKKNFHVYSRIHGDIERDYNYFQIDTTYFSQGPGNFRDVCQNRRLDVILSPTIGDFNLRMFLSFIQADGYNPLTVASTVFKLSFEKIEPVVKSLSIEDPLNNGAGAAVVRDILRRSFRPGQFFRDVEANGVTFGISKDEVLSKIISESDQDFAAQFAQNGFWADHWTYILDLVDSYVAVFPDKEEYMLFDSEPIPFFVSPAVVKPRVDRYMLVQSQTNPNEKVVRAYKPISVWGDPDFPSQKVDAMNKIFTDPHYLVDPNGAAGVWQRRSTDSSVVRVSAISKFLLLCTLKFATLDPFGMGVEMEGGKPGWNDAMNGLPGLLGSGMPETFEMLRIATYIRKSLKNKFSSRSIDVPTEFGEFLEVVNTALDTYSAEASSPDRDFKFWDATNLARETYRSKVVGTFSGQMTSLSSSIVVNFLEKLESKVKNGIGRAVSTSSTGITPTYFYYDMVDYSAEIVSSRTSPIVTAKKFELRTLPLFLEGPTRHLKVLESIDERRHIYNAIKDSSLYDVALKMYTLSESLAGMGQDIGRMKAFSPGWLENQSVWLHMSYKYYLELLRGGLYEEFFHEITTGLVPFMDNDVYGRSPLEAASFIVSSAFPDAKLHGASFLARLSGSTAEFLSMWSHMMAGATPFILNSENQLELKLSPILPSWLFNEDGVVSFKFLGKITVTYRNPSKIDSWKINAKRIVLTNVDGVEVVVEGGIIGSPLASQVREGGVKSIEVFY